MISYCPEHNIELRIEYYDDTMNGYCDKCLKHYRLCCDQSGKDVRMECCTKVKGHDGKHQWIGRDNSHQKEW